MLAALLLVACEQSEPIRVVPIAGCGLDQTFSGLRVRVVGDFPPTSSTELLLGAGETGELERLPMAARGVAVEGVFGMTITAIGRSYGIDPQLAQGRIPGQTGPVLPIWFAPPDSMCALPSAAAPAPIDPRSGFAWAEAASGDVLIVGGRAATGLISELIHYDALSNIVEVHALAEGSTTARVGHSVHGLDHGRFLVLGGAGASARFDDAVLVSLTQGSPVLESLPLATPLVHHAAASSSRARVLVAGGCDPVDELGQCSAAVHGRAAWIDMSPGPDLVRTALPELQSARADGLAFVTSDGLAFVAGGFDQAGLGLGSVERLAPGADAWTTVVEFAVEALAGMTVLDGELILVADVDGDLHWWSPAGSGTLDPSLRAPTLGPTLGPRLLQSLAGERVLVDTWLFAPGSAAVDPSAEIIDLVGNVSGESTPARTGAGVLALRDGSVLLAGGTLLAPSPDAPLPFLARVRPQLDGPDEQVPELASPRSDAFVSNTPGAAAVIVGGLRLTGSGSPDELPRTRAHVRGFRSRSFRLEFELGAEQGNTATLVVGQGATLALVVELAPGEVAVRLREASGELSVLDCGAGQFETEFPAVLEVSEAGLRVRLLQADQVVVDCSLAMLDPWPDEGGLHVGFGVAGPGDRTFRSLRLARQ